MRLTVDHKTVYRFQPAKRGVIQSHRLTPAIYEGQQVIEWAVDVPEAMRGAMFRDGAGDWVETVKMLGPVEEVTVHVRGVVETMDLHGVLRGHREKVPPSAYLQSTRATRSDIALAELAAGAVADVPEDDFLQRAHELSNAVADAIEYVPGETSNETTAVEALALGRGVCQDHAHALIACALTLDIPARYVCGYLFADATGAAHEASHGWAELYVQDLGWVGFDAANRVCPDEKYIRLGSGADAVDAAPIRGVARGVGEEEMDVSVSITQAQQ